MGKNERKGWKRAIYIMAIVGVGLLAGGGFLIFARSNVPDFSILRSSVEMRIVLADGTETIRMVGPLARGWVPLESISNFVLLAVIASEDTTFFHHKGIDFHELHEAIKKDIREKRWARGASTITQQLIKNVFLSTEKTLWRKLWEVVWAWKLDKSLTKPEILCFYVNMAEFGPGIYGIGEASRHYFGNSPTDISIKQAAFLAMLLPSPRKYHSYFIEKKLSPWAEKRVEQIVKVMYHLGFISESEYEQGQAEILWNSETEGLGVNGVDNRESFPSVGGAPALGSPTVEDGNWSLDEQKAETLEPGLDAGEEAN